MYDVAMKKTMMKILANEHLNNLDLTINDLNWALEIYGEAPENLAGNDYSYNGKEQM